MKRVLLLLVLGLVATAMPLAAGPQKSACYEPDYDWEANSAACDQQAVEDYLALASSRASQEVRAAAGQEEASALAVPATAAGLTEHSAERLVERTSTHPAEPLSSYAEEEESDLAAPPREDDPEGDLMAAVVGLVLLAFIAFARW